MRVLFKWLLGLVIVGLLAVIGAGGAFLWWTHQPMPLARESIDVAVEPGMGPGAVADAWVAGGVQTHALLLRTWFRWSGQAKRIRAGSYEVRTALTPRQLLDKMVRGDEILESVKLLEGWTFKQFRAALAKAPHLRQSIGAMTDADVMKAVGAAGVLPEGRFFPDTYAYGRGVSDLVVLKRAHTAMQRQLDKAWEQRPGDSPLKSKDEALILASIVEKETGLEADRGKVAAVFNNRLRSGMLLQTDPTVIYGLGDTFDGNLRKRDLQTDTPYNTYTRKGLPPTPIAAAGAPSIRAAIKPDASKALYFVARSDGSGGSVFSDSLEAHNRAVNEFQRKRK
jgi:UPF0755 protein